LAAAIGAVVGAVAGVVGYVGYHALMGEPITWGGVAGAASGGAVSGAIFGAVVGAGTGDPSALAVIGIGALSGGAGGLTNSVVSQAIDRGQIDCGQLVVDTGIGIVIGGATAGLAKVSLTPRPGPTSTPATSQALTPRAPATAAATAEAEAAGSNVAAPRPPVPTQAIQAQKPELPSKERPAALCPVAVWKPMRLPEDIP